MIARLGLTALRAFDPETAHGLALRALRMGLAPTPGPFSSPRLRTRLFGLDLPNPIGLAAGFDKNAVALAPLTKAGFGFVEIGAITPRAQPGNPRPRLFRLTRDRAAINRFGFNNDGMEAAAGRLSARPKTGVVGLNVGANKDSADRQADFAAVLARLGPLVDFAVINVSSPNTPGLRALQDGAALRDLLAACRAAAGALPLAVKIAPDLHDADIEAVAGAALETGMAGIVATNTTLARTGLRSRHAPQAGGLSGRPVFARSTEVLARLRRLTEGRLQLVGVGGVESAETAYAKIRAGADAAQLYTALAYGGLGLVGQIARGLDAALARDGYASVAEAVGADAAASTCG